VPFGWSGSASCADTFKAQNAKAKALQENRNCFIVYRFDVLQR